VNDGPTNDQINLPGAAALRRRYRTDMAPPPEWNGVLDTLLAHRSTRAFLPGAVSDATLATLVAAASSASTSSNLQTWSVLAVRDPGRKARLATLAANEAVAE
jgi:nitroreductase